MSLLKLILSHLHQLIANTAASQHSLRFQAMVSCPPSSSTPRTYSTLLHLKQEYFTSWVSILIIRSVSLNDCHLLFTQKCKSLPQNSWLRRWFSDNSKRKPTLNLHHYLCRTAKQLNFLCSLNPPLNVIDIRRYQFWFHHVNTGFKICD